MKEDVERDERNIRTWNRIKNFNVQGSLDRIVAQRLPHLRAETLQTVFHDIYSLLKKTVTDIVLSPRYSYQFLCLSKLQYLISNPYVLDYVTLKLHRKGYLSNPLDRTHDTFTYGLRLMSVHCVGDTNEYVLHRLMQRMCPFLKHMHKVRDMLHKEFVCIVGKDEHRKAAGSTFMPKFRYEDGIGIAPAFTFVTKGDFFFRVDVQKNSLGVLIGDITIPVTFVFHDDDEAVGITYYINVVRVTVYPLSHDSVKYRRRLRVIHTPQGAFPVYDLDNMSNLLYTYKDWQNAAALCRAIHLCENQGTFYNKLEQFVKRVIDDGIKLSGTLHTRTTIIHPRFLEDV